MKSLPIALLMLGLAPSGALAQSDEAADTSSPAAADEPAEDSEIIVEPAAPAADETADDEIIVEGEVPKEKRRICEMQTATGSIMPKRVCRTVAQIEEDERTARESLEIIKRDRDTRSHVQMSREQGQ
jgi:hypothetical protein